MSEDIFIREKRKDKNSGQNNEPWRKVVGYDDTHFTLFTESTGKTTRIKRDRINRYVIKGNLTNVKEKNTVTTTDNAQNNQDLASAAVKASTTGLFSSTTGDDFLEQKKAEIEERLVTLNAARELEIERHMEKIAPLNTEAQQLQGAIDALSGKKTIASDDANRKRGRPRGTGTRAKEAIEIITKHPGLTASEIAEKMGINQNYLYRVLPALEQDDKIVKSGRGWYMAESPA